MTGVDHEIILEPLDPPAPDVEAWWDHLDSFGAADFLVGGEAEDERVEPDDAVRFDQSMFCLDMNAIISS